MVYDTIISISFECLSVVLFGLVHCNALYLGGIMLAIPRFSATT